MSASKTKFEENFNDARKNFVEKKNYGSNAHLSNDTKLWAINFERRLERSMPNPTGNPSKDLIALESHLAFLDKMEAHFEGISQSCEEIRLTIDRMCGKHPEPEKNLGKMKEYTGKLSGMLAKIYKRIIEK